MLRKNKRKGIDYANDSEKSQYSTGLTSQGEEFIMLYVSNVKCSYLSSTP
jgi:hypothetical protein